MEIQNLKSTLQNEFKDRGFNKIGNLIPGRGARLCVRTETYRSYLTLISKWIVFSGFSLLTLNACTKTLDSDKIAQNIQQEVIRQGGISLKTVTCPSKVKLEVGKTFECIGEIESGYSFTIPVKQQNEQGQVTWDVPHAKGLLNMAKFETTLQTAVQSEMGSRPIIHCGEGFKSIKPGQIFECNMEVKPLKNAKNAPNFTTLKALTTKTGKNSNRETIVVSVSADGNVDWQRVMPGAVSQLLPQPAESRKAAIDLSPTAKSSPPTTKPPAAPAKKNAEDFLNQPGASDQFED